MYINWQARSAPEFLNRQPCTATFNLGSNAGCRIHYKPPIPVQKNVHMNSSLHKHTPQPCQLPLTHPRDAQSSHPCLCVVPVLIPMPFLSLSCSQSYPCSEIHFTIPSPSLPSASHYPNAAPETTEETVQTRVGKQHVRLDTLKSDQPCMMTLPLMYKSDSGWSPVKYDSSYISLAC